MSGRVQAGIPHMFAVRGRPRKPFVMVTRRDITLGRHPQGGGQSIGLSKEKQFTSGELTSDHRSMKRANYLNRVLKKQPRKLHISPVTRTPKKRGGGSVSTGPPAGAGSEAGRFGRDPLPARDGIVPGKLPADRLLKQVREAQRLKRYYHKQGGHRASFLRPNVKPHRHSDIDMRGRNKRALLKEAVRRTIKTQRLGLGARISVPLLLQKLRQRKRRRIR